MHQTAKTTEELNHFMNSELSRKQNYRDMFYRVKVNLVNFNYNFDMKNKWTNKQSWRTAFQFDPKLIISVLVQR